MHVRQQVRSAIVAKVKEVPDLRKSTFESRVYQLTKDEMPAALVYTESEASEKATRQNAPGINKRHIETVVYIFARANENIEDALDDLAELVENKVLEDQTLGGIALETVFVKADLLIGGDPDAPTGASRMSFVTIILTKNGASEVPIQKSGGAFS